MSNGTVVFEYVDPSTFCDDQTMTISIHAENVTVSSNSKISSDGKGYPAVTSVLDAGDYRHGECCDVFTLAGGGGGGHGGLGGDGFGGSAGTSYGNFVYPRHCGSGGGGTAASPGGRGGGVVHLIASMLLVDEVISTDGSSASGPAGGGGTSGGSIMIQAASMFGGGDIRANGGQGSYSLAAFGGGGAGGRISVQVNGNGDDFTGQMLAAGGTSDFILGDDTVLPLTKATGTDILEWLDGSATRAAPGTIYTET
jgi:hypothetical protein